MLGFDEVVDITAIEGQLMQEAQLLAESSPETSLISSVCPVINRLIETNYPMLLNSVVPLNYPSEVAAKQIRRRTKDKGNVGIFNFCECEAKLALAKYPYGNKQYEVDHSLAIVDIFPRIKQNMCVYEPIVEVYDNQGGHTTYVHVNAEKAEKILEEHIGKGKVVEEYTVDAAKNR